MLTHERLCCWEFAAEHAPGSRVVTLSAQEEKVDADQVPYWIRAHFVMEERWGELEAEHSAAAEAVQLAEAWGMVRHPDFLPSSF